MASENEGQMKIRVEKKLRRNDEPLEHDEHIPYPAHMESLPNEILAEIFEAGVSISKDQRGTLPIQSAISGVNRRWRRVAVSTPRLWSTILFHCDTRSVEYNFNHLHLWIERSAPCALDITIVVQPQSMSESNVTLAMDQMILHVDRWHRLTIKGISRRMIDSVIKSLCTVSAPRLQHFDLSVLEDYGHFARHHKIFTGGATALTSARIVGLCQVCTPPLVGLTALHFGGACRPSGSIRLTHDEFRDLLTASPSLADLALEALEIWTSPSASASNVHIPSLRTLSLNFAYCEDSFVQIFTLLSTPILETLSLAHMAIQHMNVFTLLSETAAPQYAALHTLKLFRCSTFREYSNEPPDNFFSTFSSVAHLYLISSTNIFLEPSSSHQTEMIPWPNLKSVTILPEVFPDVILTRMASGHPITTAYVPHERLSSDEILWARIREDVEVLEVDNVSDSVQYPGGLDHCMVEEIPEEDLINYDYGDYDGDRHERHAFYEQTFGVDYDGSDDSELLEYWAVCGSD
ncbi:hypothetical protein PILCRDRAFT_8843 [Piloderma croceum F 1598]|uniref:Uncharacterized protein n=1 Tax=Piloderma croceum (strain F 1598) TaxID=765440 RepID=A0A0C3F942_PILCF|nr:hypothetical protein PILCRDRAFT_8843 [Piloderma croceum F 1598]